MKAELKLISLFLLSFVFSITNKISTSVDPLFLGPFKIYPEQLRIDYIFDASSDFDGVSKQFMVEFLESSVQVTSYLLQDTFTALKPSARKSSFCPYFDQISSSRNLASEIILVILDDKNSKNSLTFEDCSDDFYSQKLGLVKVNMPLILAKNENSLIYNLVGDIARAYFENNEIIEKLDKLFDTSLGVSCTTSCKVCNTNTGTCVTCYDPTHMSIKNGVCYCTDPNAIFFPTTSSCICKNGYFLNSTNVCAPCPSICATCSNLTSCSSCISPTQMTLYNNWCYCSYPEGSAFNSTTLICSCPSGTWTNGQYCKNCNATCSTCNSEDLCTSCVDYIHMNLIGGFCSCKDPNAAFNETLGLCECAVGYYMNNTICLPCQPSCETCSNSAFCDSCVDIIHMSLNNGKCSCSEENSYFNASTQLCTCYNGSYMNGPSCASCQPPCGFCNSATNCVTCVDSRMTLSNGICSCPANSTFTMAQVSCVCNIGLFFNSSQVCIPCLSTCASCNNTSSCLSCIDPNHMTLSSGTCSCTDPLATFNSTSQLCFCPTGMYMGSLGYCTSCPSACPSCTSPTNCLSCSSAAAGYLPYTLVNGVCTCGVSNSQPSDKNGCICSNGYYQPPNQAQCLICQGPCQNCYSTQSSIQCISCVDPRMVLDNGYCQCSPNNSYYSPQLNSCQCNKGYYMNGFICSTCSLPCETCANTALNCTSCILPSQMTLNDLSICICTNPSGSYYNSQLNQCVCPVRTYLNNANCENCDDTCMICENSEECLSCVDPNHMTLSNGICSCPANSTFTGNNCTCNSEFFWHGKECVECQPPCQQCVNQTTCTSCFDPNNMILNNGICKCKDSNAYFDPAKELCVCPLGYFSSNSVCRACQSTCSTCQNNTACTSCIDQSHMALSNGVCSCRDPNASFNSSQKMCVCSAGYQLANDVCISCPVQCTLCTANNVCIFCSNPSEMSVISGNCVCNQANTVYNAASNNCICPENYYYDGSQCLACYSSMCSTCESNRCLSCIDKVNMTLSSGVCYCSTPNSFFNSFSGSCECLSGYLPIIINNTLECMPIAGPCAEFSIDGSCTSCVQTKNSPLELYKGNCYCTNPNMYYNITLGDCYCSYGYYSQYFPACTKINGCIEANSNGCLKCIYNMIPTLTSSYPTNNPYYNVNYYNCSCVAGTNYNSTLNACICSNEGITYWNGTGCGYCGCPSCSYNGTCLEPCPQNTTWNATAGSCSCNSNLYSCDYSTCCSMENTCTNYNNMNQCTNCVANMNPPTSYNNYNCFCQPGFVYSQELNYCVCPPGQWSSCITCECFYCNRLCAICTNVTACTSCLPTLLLQNGTCSCDPNAQLSYPNSCICNNGYYMNSDSVCVRCPDSCSICASYSTCYFCSSSDLMLIQGNCVCKDNSAVYNATTNQCECTVGHYRDGSSCVSCLATCYDCLDDGTTCISCSDENNMILNNGVCSCVDPNAVFNSSTLKCECQYGYYNNICSACGPSCSECVNNQCLSCYDSSHMVLVGNSCTCLDPNSYYVEWAKACACSSGFYNSGVICVPFPGLIFNKKK